MKHKSTIIAFIIGFIVTGSLIAVFMMNKPGSVAPAPPVDTTAQPKADAPKAPTDDGASAGKTPDITPPPAPPVFKPSELQGSPEALTKAVTGLMKKWSDEDIEALVTNNILDRASFEKIKQAMESKTLILDETNPFTEVGSWDAGKIVRYRLNFMNGITGIVDLKKDDDNLWSIVSVELPDVSDPANPKSAVANDAMGTAEAFVQAILKSDFSTASSLVDQNLVSNATLAGLCILFEEGDYELRANNALKGMFGSQDNAGFLIYLTGKNKTSANMGLTVKRNDSRIWRVSEVSLDSLLSSYIKEIAGGEEVYVPLVKNPKGGDSLVLFFGFNEDTLTPRSIKQLNIVASILKISGSKKLEISGHTDDVGGETYNLALSERRAAAVKDALIKAGVPEDQVVTKGFGKKQPRRSYGSADSEIQKDEARRINRRAEMYLDF